MVNPTSVVVVSSQVIFAKALCQLLAADEGLDVLGDAETVTSANLRAVTPELVLLDVDGQLALMDEAIESCRAEVPEVRVCLLSAQLQPEILQRGLTIGASGYIIKDVSPDELIRALKIIAGGGTYVDPRIAGDVLSRRANSKRRNPMFELTAREHEVMRLIAQGLSNREISERLNVSDKTVKNHVSHIFSKLNIATRSQAAVHAVRVGLI
jgi:DNA-binding NarL/FixJ family response regulator